MIRHAEAADVFDNSHDVLSDLAFPDSDWNEAERLRRPVRLGISCPVRGDLLRPQRDIGAPVDRADVVVSVPEAAVDPDGEPVPWQ